MAVPHSAPLCAGHQMEENGKLEETLIQVNLHLSKNGAQLAHCLFCPMGALAVFQGNGSEMFRVVLSSETCLSQYIYSAKIHFQ